MNFEKLTKVELGNKYEALLIEFEDLQQRYNDLDALYGELERNASDKQVKIINEANKPKIKSLDNFIWKLKCENLYTDEMAKFIEDYLKFYNE